MSAPIDIVCGACDGEDVVRDAWASWNAAQQYCQLFIVLDYAHCHDCDGETPLEEQAIATPASVGAT